MSNILGPLTSHLVQTTERLGISEPRLRAEETATEAELCMAGKRFKMPRCTDKGGFIGLKPTIWVSCGSERCRRKVHEDIGRLPYLNRFLSTHNMDEVHVCRGAPRPATTERSPDRSERGYPIENVSFHIQLLPDDAGTICGAKARYTVHTAQGNYEHYSTIGGLVCIDNQVFGLTTAHGVVGEISYRTAISKSDIVSISTLDSDHSSNDSESEDESDTTEHQDGRNLSLESRPYSQELDGLQWKRQQFPRTLAYLNCGTSAGDWSFPENCSGASDFALIDLNSYSGISNNFISSKGPTPVSGHLLLTELVDGEVNIINARGQMAIPGQLLPGEFSVILKGVIMRTKKIRIQSHLGKHLLYSIFLGRATDYAV